MKKILILGASGFIGKSLKEYFDKLDKYEIFTPTSKELDLVDEVCVNKYLQDHYFDIVIHAANYGIGIDKTKDASSIFKNIMHMFLNLQKNSSHYGKLFHLGSGAEFDKRYPIISVKEEDIGKTIPIDQYGLAKYVSGHMTENISNIYNLRLFGIFGKYEYWPVKFISNSCCKAIKGLPLTIRQNVYFDYLWIGDFCKIMEWFIEHTAKYHTYNIVTGQKTDLLTICNYIKKISQKDLPIYICKEGLANEYTADNDRLLRELEGFEFTPIEEAIKQLYTYYQEKEAEIDFLPLLYQ